MMSPFSLPAAQRIKVPAGSAAISHLSDGKTRQFLPRAMSARAWFTEYNVLAVWVVALVRPLAYFVTRPRFGRVEAGCRWRAPLRLYDPASLYPARAFMTRAVSNWTTGNSSLSYDGPRSRRRISKPDIYLYDQPWG